MVAQAQQAQTTPKLVNTRTKSRKATDAVCAEILTMEAAGKSRSEIAQTTGLSKSYISKILTGQMRAAAFTYKREMGLLDKQEHTYVYGETGEQVGILETEDAKQARIEVLITERRALEKRIREINNELADLDNIPF